VAASRAVDISTGEQRMEAISVLYGLLKEQQPMYAFATAEAALHHNPEHPLRFGLGLDYHRKRLHQLFLYHFKYLCERDPEHGDALHNFALACSECKLPISSVANYKRAFSSGVTLSAANLGFDYLSAGMAAEATAIITDGMKIDGHEPRVERCLAEIGERTAEEKRKMEEILAEVTNKRKALIEIGEALRRKVERPIDGTWQLPFGPTGITCEDGVVEGYSERVVEDPPLIAGGKAVTRTVGHTLKGHLSGSVCEFEIEIDDGFAVSKLSSLAALMGGSNKKISGYLAFYPDGASAQYCEVEDNSLRKVQTVVRS
jgi:hypothetical protein